MSSKHVSARAVQAPDFADLKERRLEVPLAGCTRAFSHGAMSGVPCMSFHATRFLTFIVKLETHAMFYVFAVIVESVATGHFALRKRA